MGLPVLLLVCGAALAEDPRGPERARLEALLAEHAKASGDGASAAALASVESRIDALAGARDAAFSWLYWYRDLAEAQDASRATGRPILSLRLLGDLTDEQSCANSRFFRTALYANAELSAWLRDSVVLHWQSVRPVPRITIDFGDGRRLERTITGNSIHYLLLPDGTVVDALPGLYGPRAFREALGPAVEVARAALALPPAQRDELLRRHQRVTVAALELRLAALGGGPAGRGARRGGPPTARDAAPVAMGKGMVERPMVAALDGLPPAADDPTWDRAAASYLEHCRLDGRSRALMLRKCTPAQRDPAAFAALTAAFERSMARDTAQGELRLRREVLRWLADGAGGDLGALNRRVYAELFRTPDADPWLGLAPLDAYSGLDGGGVLER